MKYNIKNFSNDNQPYLIYYLITILILITLIYYFSNSTCENIIHKENFNTDTNSTKPILKLGSEEELNDILIGGIFKLKVNLPMMPPYIKSQKWDPVKGTDPNYFYLSVEKLDPNCMINTKKINIDTEIKIPEKPVSQPVSVNSILNNIIPTTPVSVILPESKIIIPVATDKSDCQTIYVDNKNCTNKALSTVTRINSNRLVLIAADYIDDDAVGVGTNSDFTLINIDGKIYLKNIQTGYILTLYSNLSTINVHGNMIADKNSNVHKLEYKLNNTLCNQNRKINENTERYVTCELKIDPEQYLMTTTNISESSPIKLNINLDNTINIQLLKYNSYGSIIDKYPLTFCKFNTQTWEFIEKTTDLNGTYLINTVCFAQDGSPLAEKNKLNFNIELVKYSPEYIKKMSIHSLNSN